MLIRVYSHSQQSQGILFQETSGWNDRYYLVSNDTRDEQKTAVTVNAIRKKSPLRIGSNTRPSFFFSVVFQHFVGHLLQTPPFLSFVSSEAHGVIRGMALHGCPQEDTSPVFRLQYHEYAMLVSPVSSIRIPHVR
jgi:hypothetical protein